MRGYAYAPDFGSVIDRRFVMRPNAFKNIFMCFGCMEEHPLAAYIFTDKVDFLTEQMMERVRHASEQRAAAGKTAINLIDPATGTPVAVLDKQDDRRRRDA